MRDAVLGLRRRKGMVLDAADHDTWSVGSFFTNPVVSQADFDRLQGRSDGPVPHFPAPDGVKLAAAWLVEHAGFGKGFPGPQASATLSTKHSLALTNRGTATAARRRRAGPRRARRGPRRVRYHVDARTGAGRSDDLAPAAPSPYPWST